MVSVEYLVLSIVGESVGWVLSCYVRDGAEIGPFKDVRPAVLFFLYMLRFLFWGFGGFVLALVLFVCFRASTHLLSLFLSLIYFVPSSLAVCERTRASCVLCGCRKRLEMKRRSGLSNSRAAPVGSLDVVR